MIMFLHAFAFVDSHDFGREITIALSRQNLGVPFFFVISGFVISLNHDVSLKNKTGLTRYAISRAAKIIPLYYIFLCLTYFFIRYVSSLDLPLAIPKNTANFADIKISSYIAHAFFLQGFNSSELNTLLDGDWSLVNEVYFYVLFPFMAMWAKDSVQRCFLLLILSYLVAIFLTIYWIRIRDISGGHIYYTFPVHLSEFVLGMTAYRLLQKEQVKVILSKYSTYLVGLISVLMIGIVDISSTLLGPHHLYSLCFALILMVFGALDSRNFPSFLLL